jgi:uncharacterized membrane protein YkgB
MNKEFISMRISRNYLYGLCYLVLLIGSVYGLLRCVQTLAGGSYVFFLGVSSLSFFFLGLLSITSPYIRVDDDRIIVYHDLIRKDTFFFYDVIRIEFESESSISIFHLNGLTKVILSKVNSFDRKKVIAFFNELALEKSQNALL